MPVMILFVTIKQVISKLNVTYFGHVDGDTTTYGIVSQTCLLKGSKHTVPSAHHQTRKQQELSTTPSGKKKILILDYVQTAEC